MQEQLTKSDLEHVKLLGIFHYVMAGLHALGVCFGGLYAFMGVGMAGMFDNMGGPNPPPPEFGDMMGTMFGVIGAAVALFSLALALITAYAGFSLQQRQRRTFCIVVAAGSTRSANRSATVEWASSMLPNDASRIVKR